MSHSSIVLSLIVVESFDQVASDLSFGNFFKDLQTKKKKIYGTGFNLQIIFSDIDVRLIKKKI